MIHAVRSLSSLKTTQNSDGRANAGADGMTGRRWAILAAALSFAFFVAACGDSSSSDMGTDSDRGSEVTSADAYDEDDSDEEDYAEEEFDEEDSSEPVSSGSSALVIGEIPASLGAVANVFTKYVNVWGVHIVATATTDDAKVLHAANVMAQYLDNDADGSPDSQAVVDALVQNRALLLMGNIPDEFENLDLEVVDGYSGQDLYGSETALEGEFDSALEEVHHLLWVYGWAAVNPDQLRDAKGSAVADAMDIARGGQFENIPASYPAGAWYTYDDETCEYYCMISEYVYWAHTSLLGAQEDRGDEIAQEWRLETPEKVRATDTAIAAIIENPALGLPTVLPDGNYQG